MLRNSSSKNVWGLYIEEDGINAIKVSKKSTKLSVEAFDTVIFSELDSNHTPQTQPESKLRFKPFPIDKKEPSSETTSHNTNIEDLADLVKKALERFSTRNQINSSDKILIAVPAQFVLSRFVNLPAVKKKQLKDIVKFEVEKHIPIESSKIIWDFHTLNDTVTPGKDTEVGIFAIKKDDVYTFLSSFQSLKDNLTTIQIGSIALYNFMLFNEQEINPTMFLEIGSENTNLMIINNDKIWIRNIPSKDLDIHFIDEVKRSTGYYRSLVKEIDIKHLIVTGTLSHQEEKKRFIAQSLGYELKDITLSKNNTMEISNLVDKTSFDKNISKLTIPMGLAIQGLSSGKINLNLIPEEFVRKVALPSKKRAILISSFIILSSLFLLCLGESLQNKRLKNLSNTGLKTFDKVVNIEKRYKKKQNEYNDIKKSLDQIALIGSGRNFWNIVIPKIFDTIPEKALLISLVTNSINSPEKTFSMSIRGKSFDPKLGFINDRIKAPLVNTFIIDKGKQIPIFEDVKIVPDSIRQDKEGINFEINWKVKQKTLLLLSNYEESLLVKD